MWLQQDILQLFIISTIVGCVLSSPMLYKKKDDNENYERELVPVSSTVIPLDIYEAHNSGTIPYSPPLSAEYKIAYLQLMHKKSHKEEDPKVLKKKYYAAEKMLTKP